jgi:hypothetical protein
MCDCRATKINHSLYFTPYFKALIIRGGKEGRKEEREGFFFFFGALLGKKKGACLVHLEIFIRSGRCQGGFGDFGVFGKHDYYESDKKLLAEEIQNSKLLNG